MIKDIKKDFNIVWYVLCWNEMPILPFMIDYWKLIARKVIVYDNNSTDGTLEYLSTFNWIEVRPYPIKTDDTLNDDIHAKIKNDCWKEQKNNGVDFVIVSDVDEIIWAKDLYEQLQQFKLNKYAIVKPQGYDMVSQEFPTHGKLLLHEQLERCYRFPMFDKCILFQPDFVNEINYSAGAHECKPIINGDAIQITSTKLFLFHFKYLSFEYIIIKRAASRDRLSEINLVHGWGGHNRFSKEQSFREFNMRWQNSIDIKNLLQNSEKIIVTMTSWKKRITNIPKVLDSIQNQTIMPNNIVINLSSEEFENKENDIPNEILEYIKNNNIIQINWIEGKNIKSWKKTIPTFNLYPNDVIITIDDDKLYPENFIEILWKKHLEYPNNPITIDGWKWPNGFWQHCGQGTLEKKEFYENDIDKWLKTDITNYADEDSFMTFMAVRHGNPFICAGKINLIDYNNNDSINFKDSGKAYDWICNILNDRFENYIHKIKLEELFIK